MDEGSGYDKSEIRSKKENFFKSLQKKSNLEFIQNKRNVGHLNFDVGSVQHLSLTHLDKHPLSESLKVKIVEWTQLQPQQHRLYEFLAMIESEDIYQQHCGIIGIRRILSEKIHLPIQKILDHSAVTKMIAFSKNSGQPHLQLEATWCLANLASGTSEQTISLIQKNVIPLFIEHLKSPYVQIVEQAIWGLGNISGDCLEFRNQVLQMKGGEELLAINETLTDPNLKRSLNWVFSNMCRLRSDKEPVNNYIIRFLPILIKNFVESVDPEVIDDSLHGMAKNGKTTTAHLFIENKDFMKKLKQVYDSFCANWQVNKQRIHSIHSILGGITSTNDDNSMIVIQEGFLRSLAFSLQFEDTSLQREICWVCSNIAIGNDNQVSLFLNETCLIDSINRLCLSPHDDVSKEALWVLCNACKSNNEQIIQKLFDIGYLKLCTELLKDQNPKKIVLIIEALTQLLSFFESKKQGQNYLVQLMLSNGLAHIFEKLQSHPSDAIYIKVLNLLEQYFDQDENFN